MSTEEHKIKITTEAGNTPQTWKELNTAIRDTKSELIRLQSEQKVGSDEWKKYTDQLQKLTLQKRIIQREIKLTSTQLLSLSRDLIIVAHGFSEVTKTIKEMGEGKKDIGDVAAQVSTLGLQIAALYPALRALQGMLPAAFASALPVIAAVTAAIAGMYIFISKLPEQISKIARVKRFITGETTFGEEVEGYKKEQGIDQFDEAKTRAENQIKFMKEDNEEQQRLLDKELKQIEYEKELYKLDQVKLGNLKQSGKLRKEETEELVKQAEIIQQSISYRINPRAERGILPPTAITPGTRGTTATIAEQAATMQMVFDEQIRTNQEVLSIYQDSVNLLSDFFGIELPSQFNTILGIIGQLIEGLGGGGSGLFGFLGRLIGPLIGFVAGGPVGAAIGAGAMGAIGNMPSGSNLPPIGNQVSGGLNPTIQVVNNNVIDKNGMTQVYINGKLYAEMRPNSV